MTLNRTRVRGHLESGNFRQLFFEELGWDAPDLAPQPVDVDGRRYTLQPIAQKRGVFAFHLALPEIPPYAERRQIEGKLVRNFREHFILFTNADKSRQVWQWVLREPGRTAGRSHEYRKGQPGESLIQKLERITFTLEQEEGIDTLEVVGSVYAAFNVERATGRFYERFRRERDAFQKFLTGIPDEEMERWYVSVMLNRLMFIYFIQKKGFLNGDADYLRTKLDESQRRGADRYYRDFLCPLFFAGFATPLAQRPVEMRTLLGNIPYLNGGIFERHEVEQRHGQTIQIPDRAFANLFDFFDGYQWHLDDRPLRDDREINPDVLGYIFEKYINQKQMGAYYTKEDITEYISKNTIIPFLFDAAQKKYPAAFKGERSVWRLLGEDPDRYIYEAVRKGADLELPPEIAAGLNDVSQRGEWNRPAPDNYALPTEIWRETVARRQRYEEVWLKLAGGEVQAINDLITYNLDIRQFAQDVIESCEDPDLLRAFWTGIREVTVLDPTCGSGAFLFAALNILEPLYEACLERMEHFVTALPPDAHPEKFKDFRQVLGEIERHPNERYFIDKSIIVNNLYGVDIMHEAVEIAKLRLFLKLAALVEIDSRKPNQGIEPLPDIDFNIRAGNTLVGFATREQMVDAVRGNRLLLLPEDEEALARVEEQAAAVDRLFARFRKMQTSQEPGQYDEDYAKTKSEVRRRLAALAEELNRLLALQYGVDPNKLTEYPQWLDSHQPFHWFVEFYGITEKGGFDVIIGNPPYVRYSEIMDVYTILNFKTISSGDLYAFVMERSFALANRSGYLSMIVPISVFAVDGFRSLQSLILDRMAALWLSHFANRPSQLFRGAQKRLTIVLGKLGGGSPLTFSTGYLRWTKGERDILFPTRINNQELRRKFRTFSTSLEKIGSEPESSLYDRLVSTKHILENALVNSGHTVYYTRKFGYFLAFLNFIPSITEIKSGKKMLPSELKSLNFRSEKFMWASIAALSSSTFFWFWNVLSDCRNLNRRDLLAFPVNPEALPEKIAEELSRLGKNYVEQLRLTSNIMIKSGLKIETFSYTRCKPILDEVDSVLAYHFGYSSEELDFVTNYDIKYRMGDALADDEGDE